jgi:hypothetical protein
LIIHLGDIPMQGNTEKPKGVDNITRPATIRKIPELRVLELRKP